MDRKTTMATAALAALTMAAGCVPRKADTAGAPKGEAATGGATVASEKKGECWGINACKGQGACGGVDHGCAGSNACKGQGWLSLTKSDCDARKGKFKS